MTYLSAACALFVVMTMVAFHSTPVDHRRRFVVIGSLLFTASWGLPSLVSVLAAAIFVHRISLAIANSVDADLRRRWLFLCLAGLFINFAFFKYASGGAGEPKGDFSWVAPLGISYWTFKLAGYAVEVYWGREPPASDLWSVITYAAFFPQSLAGPIQRSSDFFAQFQSGPHTRPSLMVGGLRLILFGAFEKLVLADRLAIVTERVFASPAAFTRWELLIAAYVFPLQLYMDFSGLTDVSRGLARLIGYETPPNFDRPFLASDLQSFWRRWHMSLTSWLADYVFVPLTIVTRRSGRAGLLACVALNMMAVALWHGAKMTFVVFGLINAGGVIVGLLTRRSRDRLARTFSRTDTAVRLRKVLGMLCTFHFMTFAFIWFRSSSVPAAADFLWGMGMAVPVGRAPVDWSRLGIGIEPFGAVVLGYLLVEVVHSVVASPPAAESFVSMPPWLRWAAYYCLLMLVIFLGVAEVRTFIYAQF